MNVTTPTARTTPSLSAPVPVDIHLSTDQIHIRSLQRSTSLRLALNGQQLRSLQLEENLLCLRPVSERSLAELTRLIKIGEKILQVLDQVGVDERHARWLETVWAASIEHERKKARGEVAKDEKTPVFDWKKLEVRME